MILRSRLSLLCKAPNSINRLPSKCGPYDIVVLQPLSQQKRYIAKNGEPILVRIKIFCAFSTAALPSSLVRGHVFMSLLLLTDYCFDISVTIKSRCRYQKQFSFCRIKGLLISFDTRMPLHICIIRNDNMINHSFLSNNKLIFSCLSICNSWVQTHFAELN